MSPRLGGMDIEVEDPQVVAHHGDLRGRELLVLVHRADTRRADAAWLAISE